MLISLIKEYKIIGAVFISVILLFTLGSCEKGCFDGAGEDSHVRVQISDFKIIKIQKNYAIHLVQDSANFVELKGKENLISSIKPKVVGNTLSFDDNNSCEILKGHHESHIYIHFSQIEKINIEGSPKIYSKDTLFFNNLVIENMGDIATWNFILKAKALNIKIQSVVGEMTIKGSVEKILLYTSGMNHCFFEDLHCNYAEVNHTSIGNIYLNVIERLNLDINASGDFYCYGNPPQQTVTIKESERGKFISVN